MEILSLYLSTGLLILLLWGFSRLMRRIDRINENLEELRREIARNVNDRPTKKVDPIRPVPKMDSDFSTSPVWGSVSPSPPPAPRPVEVPAFPERSQEAFATESKYAIIPSFPEPAAPERKSFLEQYPDLEKFIGENLINKVGIGVLVLGIGFFVKYAIDQEWISEVGRVLVGIVCGGALIGLAHRLRRNYPAFGSVLVGGGISVLYFTVAIAFHLYHLMPQISAFLAMVAITGLAIFLSILYDRRELAVVAALGGFASPLMVSTGGGNYLALFTYLLILNSGMLVLAYLKRWSILHYLCFGFTVVLFGGWVGRTAMAAAAFPYGGALVFASLFYQLFFLMSLAAYRQAPSKQGAAGAYLLLSNNALYYAAGMFFLSHLAGGDYRGIFTLLLSLLTGGFAFRLYRSVGTDRHLLLLLTGLAITFLSLAGPVQLDGNHVTLFWALEAVLLVWFSQQSGIGLFRTGSALVTGCLLLSLIRDWGQSYLHSATLTEHLPVLLNRAFITGLFAVGSLAGSRWLLRREDPDAPIFAWMRIRPYRLGLGFLLAVFLYLVLLLELRYQLYRFVSFESTRLLFVATYTYLYVLGLLLCARLRPQNYLPEIAAGLGLLVIAAHLLYYNQLVIAVRDTHLLAGGAGKAGFVLHYLGLGLLAAVAWLSLKTVAFRIGFSSAAGKALLWFACFAAVFVASAELDHLSVWLGYGASNTPESITRQIHQIGYPILWGLCSLALMLLGMKWKQKDLRMISLTLFTITLIKLFLFDIRGIAEGGKIAAFISLGILLLIVSFMYQKLKNLLLADESRTAGSTKNKTPPAEPDQA